MAGLLDFLDTDEGRMGIGLLMAGSQRSDGAGFGQRLGEGLQYVQTQKDGDAKRKFQQAQMDNYASEIEARKLATIKDARVAEQASQFMSGGGGQPNGGSAMGGSAGQNGAPGGGGFTAEGIARQFGIPIEAVKADYQFNGGKKIAELISERSKPNYQNVNGNLVNTNAPGFAGGLQAGMSSSADGKVNVWQPDGQGGLVVGAPRGALETTQAYALQGARIASMGKVNMRKNADGTESPVPESFENSALFPGGRSGPTPQPMIGRTGNPMVDAVMQTESNGNPSAVSPKGARGLMQVMPGTNTAPGYGVTPARDNSEGERTRVGQDYLAAMQARYKDNAIASIAYNWGPDNTDKWLKGGADYNKLPPETQSYVGKVLIRNGVNGRNNQGAATEPNAAPAGPARYGMSNDQVAQADANRAGMVDTAKAGVVRDTALQTKARNAGDTISSVDRAISLLGKNPTNSGIGAMADTGAAFFGKTLPGADVAAQLDVVSADIVKNVPRFEGPQSDKDVDQYKSAAGRVADRSLPIAQRLSAAQEVKLLQSRAVGSVASAAPFNEKQAPTDFKSAGYADQAAAIRDANNAIMRGAPRDAVQKRLQSMGLSLPNGAQGGW